MMFSPFPIIQSNSKSEPPGWLQQPSWFSSQISTFRAPAAHTGRMQLPGPDAGGLNIPVDVRKARLSPQPMGERLHKAELIHPKQRVCEGGKQPHRPGDECKRAAD